jgi:hypothetical protein
MVMKGTATTIVKMTATLSETGLSYYWPVELTHEFHHVVQLENAIGVAPKLSNVESEE